MLEGQPYGLSSSVLLPIISDCYARTKPRGIFLAAPERTAASITLSRMRGTTFWLKTLGMICCLFLVSSVMTDAIASAAASFSEDQHSFDVKTAHPVFVLLEWCLVLKDSKKYSLIDLS